MWITIKFEISGESWRICYKRREEDTSGRKSAIYHDKSAREFHLNYSFKYNSTNINNYHNRITNNNCHQKVNHQTYNGKIETGAFSFLQVSNFYLVPWHNKATPTSLGRSVSRWTAESTILCQRGHSSTLNSSRRPHPTIPTTSPYTILECRPQCSNSNNSNRPAYSQLHSRSRREPSILASRQDLDVHCHNLLIYHIIYCQLPLIKIIAHSLHVAHVCYAKTAEKSLLQVWSFLLFSMTDHIHSAENITWL